MNSSSSHGPMTRCKLGSVSGSDGGLLVSDMSDAAMPFDSTAQSRHVTARRHSALDDRQTSRASQMQAFHQGRHDCRGRGPGRYGLKPFAPPSRAPYPHTSKAEAGQSVRPVPSIRPTLPTANSASCPCMAMTANVAAADMCSRARMTTALLIGGALGAALTLQLLVSNAERWPTLRAEPRAASIAASSFAAPVEGQAH